MLTVNQQKMDLGKLKYGVPHNFDYIVTNSSKDKITINKIVLGCNSCTKALMSKTTLNPGDNASLAVTFTPGSKGRQLKNINIQYDSNKNIELKFSAIVDE